MKLIKEAKHEIKVTCVISEKYYEPFCEAYGFETVWAENDPLGAKINTGIKHALKHEFDYLMMMNSDDIIDSKLINKYYKPFFESLNPFFGINKVTYVNFDTKEAREFNYGFSILGIGKCIRRDIVLAMNGELYDDKRNRLLDDGMLERVVFIGGAYPSFVNYEGQLAMDFKSETNIWPWEKYKNRGKEVCYKER